VRTAEVPVIDVAFVDDECLMLQADTAGQLRGAVEATLAALVSTFSTLSFDVNWKPGKTECFVGGCAAVVAVLSWPSGGARTDAFARLPQAAGARASSWSTVASTWAPRSRLTARMYLEQSAEIALP